MGEALIGFDGRHVRLEPWGLNITGDIEWDEFSALGKKLLTVHDCMQFALGDWINYGGARWGEKYKEALEKTPYPYHTLATFSWVCRRFPSDIREQISNQLENYFSYTRLLVVSRLPDDVVLEMLELAKLNRWTVSKLQEEVDRRYPLPAGIVRKKDILKIPHYGEPNGPGFYVWFGFPELPLLQQILPKHPGTILMQKRLAQVVDVKAKT